MGEHETLRALVLATLTSVAPEAEIDSLDDRLSFRDQLEIDSVDFLNFVLSLERALGIGIPEIDYPRLSSLGGCLKYLESRLP